MVSRQAHNLEVAGSTPAPATNQALPNRGAFFVGLVSRNRGSRARGRVGGRGSAKPSREGGLHRPPSTSNLAPPAGRQPSEARRSPAGSTPAPATNQALPNRGAFFVGLVSRNRGSRARGRVGGRGSAKPSREGGLHRPPSTSNLAPPAGRQPSEARRSPAGSTPAPATTQALPNRGAFFVGLVSRNRGSRARGRVGGRGSAKPSREGGLHRPPSTSNLAPPSRPPRAPPRGARRAKRGTARRSPRVQGAPGPRLAPLKPVAGERSIAATGLPRPTGGARIGADGQGARGRGGGR